MFNFYIKISGTYICFQSTYVNLKIDKMIVINHDTINRQADNLQNKGIIHCLESYKFRCIKISGNRNQCLQYCLNAFYYDVDDLKKGIILWSVVH